jgi:hypothetical protein
MKNLFRTSASNKPTTLTEQAFLGAIEKARKILNEFPLPRPLMYNYKLIESRFIGEQKLQTSERTWKERLFSWPWRPWKKLKHFMVVIPSGDFIIDHQNGVVYAHPVDLLNLKRAIENYDSDIIPDNDSIGDRRQAGEPGA